MICKYSVWINSVSAMLFATLLSSSRFPDFTFRKKKIFAVRGALLFLSHAFSVPLPINAKIGHNLSPFDSCDIVIPLSNSRINFRHFCIKCHCVRMNGCVWSEFEPRKDIEWHGPRDSISSIRYFLQFRLSYIRGAGIFHMVCCFISCCFLAMRT